MSVQQFIDDLETRLPDVATAAQLVKFGVFSSRFEALRRRADGKGPEFIALSARRIVYPKSSVVEWLRERATVSHRKDRAEEHSEQPAI